MTQIGRRHFFQGIAGGALGIAGSGGITSSPLTAAWPVSNAVAADGGMQILSAFDGGLLPAATIDGGTITFDLHGVLLSELFAV